jgi:hypothetical protein
MAFNNQAYIKNNSHTVKVGRAASLEKDTTCPVFGRANTSKRGFVRVGRKAYVQDVNGRRRK